VSSSVSTRRKRNVKIAAQLFDFQHRRPSSPFVDEIWRTTSVPDERFVSVATCGWEIVFTRQDELTRVTVRGPETKATVAPIPPEAEFIGIRFPPGAFMPWLAPVELVDAERELPVHHDGRSFWLDGSQWILPLFDDVEALVDKLVRADVLVVDRLAARALTTADVEISERSVQRRIARATGLTRRLRVQIERAQRAAEMLLRGVSIADVVSDAGYSDQAHLTRSLRRFIGKTPAQLARATRSG
jgi:AraC-like DNA-binding protein